MYFRITAQSKSARLIFEVEAKSRHAAITDFNSFWNTKSYPVNIESIVEIDSIQNKKITKKRCIKCNKIKRYSAFNDISRITTNNTLLSGMCKYCHTKYNKQYKSAHKKGLKNAKIS